MSAPDQYANGNTTLRRGLGLDPAKPFWPQAILPIAFLGNIFGGPIIALIAIKHYPALVSDNTIYSVGLGSIAILFVASFGLIPRRLIPKHLPLAMELPFRAGWALCTTFLWVGLALITNGYDTPLVARNVAVVGKVQSLERDPSRRSYSLEARAWPNSRFVTRIDVTPRDFENANVPFVNVRTSESELEAMPDAATALLTVGQGRLGLEWIKSIDMH